MFVHSPNRNPYAPRLRHHLIVRTECPPTTVEHAGHRADGRPRPKVP